MKQHFQKLARITAAISFLAFTASSGPLTGGSIYAVTLGPDGGPSSSNTVCGQDSSSPKGQVLTGATATGGDCTGVGVTNIVQTVVSILSYIIGAAAVVMIILAAFKYVTSAGDSNKISSAKSSLVYALVGLAIAALAQLLVHFVLQQSTNAANNKTGFALPPVSSQTDTA